MNKKLLCNSNHGYCCDSNMIVQRFLDGNLKIKYSNIYYCVRAFTNVLHPELRGYFLLFSTKELVKFLTEEL